MHDTDLEALLAVGPRRAVASVDEERRLAERRLAADLPYDLRPRPSATLEDLDLDYFERVYLLVRNAILHRTYEISNAPVRCYWYTDRIVIQNPGGPYGQVTVENFGQTDVTDYRNPHLAEAMRVLGFVQRFGVGIEIARQELAANGNPPPRFDVQGTYVAVTVSKGTPGEERSPLA